MPPEFAPAAFFRLPLPKFGIGSAAILRLPCPPASGSHHTLRKTRC